MSTGKISTNFASYDKTSTRKISGYVRNSRSFVYTGYIKHCSEMSACYRSKNFETSSIKHVFYTNNEGNIILLVNRDKCW